MPEYVRDTGLLTDICGRLRASGVVALDTEFMRERTYYARLCLVQLASDDEIALVDPLAPGISLAPLYELLADPEVLKVVHAGTQDLEIFYHATGRVPAPVFDTQVAATLAGFPNQVGYGALVSGLAGVDLGKGERFTDWSRRPLDERQIEYAEQDVRYLLTVWRELHRRLDEDGRLDWVTPDFDALSDPSSYEVVPQEQYTRVKRASSLNRRQLAVLREVTAWRELEARRRDVPRRRVLPDEVLVEVARRGPRDEGELLGVRGMDGRHPKTAVRSLLAAVDDGLKVPESALPRVQRRSGPRAGEGVVELMTAYVRARAREHGVAAPVLAAREDLEALASGRRDGNPLLEGWRLRLIGRDLVELMEGRIALGVDGGVVTPFRRGEGR